MLTKRKFLAAASVLGSRIVFSLPRARGAVEERSGHWYPLAVGAGGYITGHSISNDGTTLVCRTDTYGCYIWNFSSSKWEQLRTATRMPSQDVAPGNGFSEAGGYEIQVAPSDAERIYMVIGFFVGPDLKSYVYVSRDRGNSFQRTSGWKPLALGSNSPTGKITNCHMAVDPVNPNVVYLGTLSNGLYVTFDAGETWNPVATVPASRNAGFSFSIAFDPTSGVTDGRTNKIYVCSDGSGFYSCRDGSGTFSAMSGGPLQVSDAAVSPIDGVLYACARDSGTANLWHCVSDRWSVLSNCNDGAHPAWSVAPDPANSNRIAVCDGRGWLNISTDHGATWPYGYNPGRRTATDIPWLAWTNEIYMSVAMIRFDPSRTNVLTFSEGIGYWTASPTDNTRQTWAWKSQNLGIEQLVANCVCSPPGGNPILAAWDRPVFRVEDRDVYPSRHGPNNTYAIQMGWSIDWASANPSTIVAVMNWFPPANDESGKSDDGGVSWTLFPAGNLPSSSISGCIGGCIAAADALTYMWIPRRNGSSPNQSQPYITLDGGATSKSWMQTIPPDVPSGSGLGWGDNFFLNRQIVCADRVFPRTFYAYHAGGKFYKYVAGGSPAEGSWSIQSSRLIPHDEGQVKIRSVPGYGGHVFACSGRVNNNSQPYCVLMRSVDGCKTFVNVANVQCVYAFGFGKSTPGRDYPTVYFAGLYRNRWGIYRSTSSLVAWNANTVEWTKVGDYPLGSYDVITCLEGDANTFGTIYVGFSGSGWAYYKLPP
jgi:hypothetical protein